MSATAVTGALGVAAMTDVALAARRTSADLAAPIVPESPALMADTDEAEAVTMTGQGTDEITVEGTAVLPLTAARVRAPPPQTPGSR